MKKITREMIMELNNELAVKGVPFRYEYKIMGSGMQEWKLRFPI